MLFHWLFNHGLKPSLTTCLKTQVPKSNGAGAAQLMALSQHSQLRVATCCLLRFQKVVVWFCVCLCMLMHVLHVYALATRSFSQNVKQTSSLRWSAKHGRPLTGPEMLGIMGLPISDRIAEWTGCPRLDTSNLSAHAQAHRDYMRHTYIIIIELKHVFSR